MKAAIPANKGTRASCPQNQGSALVIALFFIVLVSILALVFLARSASEAQGSTMSSGMVQNQILAVSAVETILADLREEMAAGATTVPTGTSAMQVTKSRAMIPARTLKAGIPAAPAQTGYTNYVNLVKQSVSGAPFYPSNAPYAAKGPVPAQGAARASAISTETPALDGRVIPAAKWNKVQLVGGTGFSWSSTQSPDWILIQRSGVQTSGTDAFDPAFADPKTQNTSYVIGRFAYNIYNVGGLLDVNVAGYNSSDTTAVADAARKGSLAWADLSVIPGILVPDALVAWRNAATSQPSSYLKKLEDWSLPQGFLKPYSDGTSNDRYFFSRQDLLNYQKEFPNVLTTEALPYLTTFTRDLNQPSFAPSPNRPKVLLSGTAGGNSGKDRDDDYNPSFLTIRDPADPTEPLVKKRFPLSRLALITDTATAGSGSNIEKYFGLTRASSSDPWVYTQGTGTTIKWLSEITGREPDMAELLQAAIHVGTLGKQYGWNGVNSYGHNPPTAPSKIGGEDGVPEYQIIQILANIIDQYDTDSYPTHIRYNGLNFYGVENLPYLYSMPTLMYRQSLATPTVPPPVANPGPTYKLAVMIQPQVWNPHAPLQTPASAGPTEFQIIARNIEDVPVIVKTAFYWRNGTGTVYSGSSSSGYVSHFEGLGTTASVTFNPATDRIRFQTTATGDAAFREPFALKYTGYPAGSNSTGYVEEPILDASELEAGNNTIIGFHLGYTWGGPVTTGNLYLSESDVFGEGISFELQYKKGTSYFTYNVMEYFPGKANHLANWSSSREFSYGVSIDPRTKRWGLQGGISWRPMTSPGNLTANRYRPQGQTLWAGPNSVPPASGSPTRVTANPLSGNGWHRSANQVYGPESQNIINSNQYYDDADGLRRGADGVFSRNDNAVPLHRTNGVDFSARPVILNRPFRSVVELGYVFRDTPWRSLDFFAPESGDAALLDVFCLQEPADADAEPVVAGRVNLNTPHAVILQALIQGVAKAQGVPITDTESLKAAEALVEWTGNLSNSNRGPLKNPAELIGKALNTTTYNGYSLQLDRDSDPIFPDAADRALKPRKESVFRALADSGTTRTWNLLIDLIVQTGKYPVSAANLSQFQVASQQHYWIHLSMDRFTGKVIARQVEGVVE